MKLSFEEQGGSKHSIQDCEPALSEDQQVLGVGKGRVRTAGLPSRGDAVRAVHPVVEFMRLQGLTPGKEHLGWLEFMHDRLWLNGHEAVRDGHDAWPHFVFSVQEIRRVWLSLEATMQIPRARSTILTNHVFRSISWGRYLMILLTYVAPSLSLWGQVGSGLFCCGVMLSSDKLGSELRQGLELLLSCWWLEFCGWRAPLRLRS